MVRETRILPGPHPDVGGRVLRQAQALRHGIAEFGTLMTRLAGGPHWPQSRPLTRTVLAVTGPGRATRGRPALPAR